jgi:hypothetical protein
MIMTETIRENGPALPQVICSDTELGLANEAKKIEAHGKVAV